MYLTFSIPVSPVFINWVMKEPRVFSNPLRGASVLRTDITLIFAAMTFTRNLLLLMHPHHSLPLNTAWGLPTRVMGRSQCLGEILKPWKISAVQGLYIQAGVEGRAQRRRPVPSKGCSVPSTSSHWWPPPCSVCPQQVLGQILLPCSCSCLQLSCLSSALQLPSTCRCLPPAAGGRLP